MLRRILLLLGETPFSISARQYGLRMARIAKAEISGFSGIDLTYIESAMPGRVGAGAYAARLEESLKKQAGDAGQRLREQFEAECQEEGVPSEFLSFEGDPIEALSSAAETHDLLISGHDTAFRGNVREQLSEVLSRLLLVTPRPMIVCPDELSPLGDILVAYDGSFAAVRAVQMFALFGVAHDRLIQIVSIDSDAGLASQRAGRAAKYVRTHGYQVNENPDCFERAARAGVEVRNCKPTNQNGDHGRLRASWPSRASVRLDNKRSCRKSPVRAVPLPLNWSICDRTQLCGTIHPKNVTSMQWRIYPGADANVGELWCAHLHTRVCQRDHTP